MLKNIEEQVVCGTPANSSEERTSRDWLAATNCIRDLPANEEGVLLCRLAFFDELLVGVQQQAPSSRLRAV